MYRFPADPERVKLWLIKTPINSHWDQWEPNHNSKLCEAHFEQNCFLTKATPAGIKRCRTKDAVPTLFSFKEPSRKRKLPKIRGSLQDIKIKPATPTTPSKVIHDHSYAYIYRSKVLHHSLYPAALSEEPPPPSENDPLDVSDLTEDAETCRFLNLNSTTCKSIAGPHPKSFKGPLLDSAVSNTKAVKTCSKSCYDDQLKQMKRQKSSQTQLTRAWKEKFIKEKEKNTFLQKALEALKLKLVCGSHGYQELPSQGYPLPSIRILDRQTQTFKSDGGLKVTEQNVAEVGSDSQPAIDDFLKQCSKILGE